MNTFRKYQHLERIGTTAVDGIEVGTCYVFPKLDGTNAQVWMSEGKLMAGSRNRTLTQENDNAGFYNWVLSNSAPYEQLFELYPGITLYGEWLVPHSLKTYRDDAWRKFYIFDVYLNGEPLRYDIYKDILDGFPELDYLVPLAIIKNGSRESFERCLEKNVFLIKDGSGTGEGVVLKNYDFVNNFGQTIWAKVVANHFKEQHHKEMGAPIIGVESVEEKIIEKFCTPELIDKTYHKIVTLEEGWQTKFIPRLLHTVFYDLIQEEAYEILKEFKFPKIDFKYLRVLVIAKVKQTKKDIF